MSDPTAHPDLAELDAARTGEATAEVEAHLRTCGQCRQAVADFASVADALRLPLPSIPEAVEQRILWMARKEAADLRRAARRSQWRTVAIRRGAAIAAGVLLALGLLRAVVPWRTARTTPALVADVDGNGVVDVRDAFLIARTLRTGADLPARFDVNGDHVVDGADVDLAARAAVALERRS
jgi:anti-sigma-K factor RskA